MGFDYEKVEKAWFKPKETKLDILEKWLEEQVIDRRYANDVERWSAYKSTLEKIQELKRSVDNK